MTKLCTIGYEGMTSYECIELLSARGVDLVIDVRELPQSRKRGFSKRGLEAALQEAGIEYKHLPELGTPTKWRRDLSAGLDFSMFTKRFEQLLNERADAVRALHEDIDGRHTCLMCYEEDPQTCHRSLIARRLQELFHEDLGVDHIRHD